MAHQDIKISELVDKIESGDIRLPEMQRQYVWQSPRVIVRLFSQSNTGKTKYRFSKLKDLKLVACNKYTGIVEILEKFLPNLKLEKLL